MANLAEISDGPKMHVAVLTPLFPVAGKNAGASSNVERKPGDVIDAEVVG